MSSTICFFLCSASGFTSIFIFFWLVFLFHNTGIFSEQRPRSRKSVLYLRDPSVTIFGFFGLRSEVRAGLVPAVKTTGWRNSRPLSRMQQNQSLQQALKKKILPAVVAVALWRHLTSVFVLGMSIIRKTWLACQSVPAFPDVWRGTGKAPSR